MAAYTRNRGGTSRGGNGALIVACVFLAAGATVAALVGGGLVDRSKLAFWSKAEPPVERPPADAIAIPICARPVPAYTKILRDHLFNTKTGKFAYVYLKREDIKPGTLTAMGDILGRVLVRDKSAGYVFTERDFAPEGTREGLTAGIPPGKRAYRLEASRIAGVHGLLPGDHLDVVASIPLDLKNGAVLPPSARIGPRPTKQAEVRVIVRDGVVVTPVATRAVPLTTSTLMQGARNSSRPVQEIVIAVEPEEVRGLSEAESLEYGLTAVAHSGIPGAPEPTSPAPNDEEPKGADGMRVIETIVGGRRQTVYFAPGSDVPIKVEGK